MNVGKFAELHTRESAGAGYDISASRSEATSQAANQQAGSVINFGSGAAGDKYAGDQSATPNATAVAARTAGNTDTAPAANLPDSSSWHEKIDWPMVAIAFVAVAAIGGAIWYARQPKG